MTHPTPPCHRWIRITQEPSQRLALLWRAPFAAPAPGDPPRLGAAQLVLVAYSRDPDGHICLGPLCHSLPGLDGLLRHYERTLQALRRKAARLHAAQAKPRARARS